MALPETTDADVQLSSSSILLGGIETLEPK